MPPTIPAPLARALATGDPFALVRRAGPDAPGGAARAGGHPDADHLDLFTGEIAVVDRLAAIPLPAAPGPQTLAVIPYRQVAERGFDCVDDAAPLECLRITGRHRLRLADALAALPDAPVTATGAAFDPPDDAYGRIVDAVLRDEIATGEGANFVIHRTLTARLATDPLAATMASSPLAATMASSPLAATMASSPLAAAAAALRHLLLRERGAYWTFLVHTGARTLVGASPERHVSMAGGTVMMNPISGTLRHPAGGPDPAALLDFLANAKEINELYMVLDEELKMMARVADLGGHVLGPYLKEMAHLVHTEYLLAGRGGADVRDVLRETMFAPTVTGSPIENACRVIARRERRGRGRYGGVLALLGHDDAGGQTLDAPILIRFAEIDPDGRLRVPVGATLVRDSTAAGEVAETHAKAAAVLAALGLRPPDAAPPAAASGSQARAARAGATGLGADPRVRGLLAARNTHLARFWLERRDPPVPGATRVLVVDAEDTFTGMLVHQLRALGLRTTLRPWRDPGQTAGFDLVVAGPGPGNPTDPADPKMATLRRLVRDLLDRRRPVLGVCLGHQIMAARLGLTVHRRAEPYQGLQREIDLFGRRHRVGYYASFTALATADRLDTRYGPVRLARDPADRSVHALRGPAFAGVQFHPESVLTEHGPDILTDLVGGLVGAAASS
jgi:phenazine biosynthesis protein phzE